MNTANEFSGHKKMQHEDYLMYLTIDDITIENKILQQIPWRLNYSLITSIYIYI